VAEQAGKDAFRMASMEFNKAAAALLTAGIAFAVSGIVAGVLVHPEAPAKTAIAIPSQEAPAASGPAAPSGPEPIAGLLAQADVQRGQQLAQRNCGACHSFNEGGKAGVGPNLYGVVGGPHGHAEGFTYSAALKGKPGPWSYDALNEWLYRPASYAPGTRMAFAGMPNTQQRADVIAWLRTLSASPQPLPPAAPAAGAPTAAAQPAATGQAPPAAPPVAAPDLKTRLASADSARGEAYAKRMCAICHTFTQGGRAGVGPNLWAVVGAPHGHMEGFNYTAGLKGHAGPWTYAELDDWLRAPAAYAPGTRMAFVGIADAAQRADVIAWLRTLAETPVPLP
jgi:cytochrome c